MYMATLTSKFQLSIPKTIRERLGLKAGQQFVFVTKDETITMVPKRNVGERRGMLREASPEGCRDRRERAFFEFTILER